MGTNAFIGIMNIDKTVSYIYCHQGTSNEIGQKLANGYNDLDKATKLLQTGNIPSLDDNRDAALLHKAWCNNNKMKAYLPGEKPQTCNNIDIFKEVCNQYTQYAYLFIDGHWKVGNAMRDADFIFRKVIDNISQLASARNMKPQTVCKPKGLYLKRWGN